MLKSRINQYVRTWKSRGYIDGIPDEVPQRLMQLGIAPSYKAVALAILNNDPNLTSLGFSTPKSEWYSFLKEIEISARDGYTPQRQQKLF